MTVFVDHERGLGGGGTGRLVVVKKNQCGRWFFCWMGRVRDFLLTFGLFWVEWLTPNKVRPAAGKDE